MNPNDIVGQPREYDVWLAPDWSDFNEKTKKGSNWTRVSVRETHYADGRVVTQVLDANRSPVSDENGARPPLSQDIDKEQEKRFNDAKGKAQQQTDQSERRILSVTYPGVGKNRKKVTKYETGPDKVEDDPETEANDPNSPAGRTAASNAATAEELNNERSWNLNHGGLYETHAERRTREQKEAQENAPKTTSQAITRNGQTYIVATTVDKNGAVVKSQVLDTSGNPVPGGLPVEVKPGTIVKGGGPKGEDVQAVADPATGAISYQPIPGATAPGAAYSPNIPAWTPNPDADDYGLAERTRQLIALADAGKIPRDAVAKQLEADTAQARIVAENRARRETNARLERQQAETERNNRSTLIGNAWTAAQTEPKGGEAYAGWNAPYRFAANMALQQAYGGMGAWGQAASSTAPTPPAPRPATPAVVAAPSAPPPAAPAAALPASIFRPQSVVTLPPYAAAAPPAAPGTVAPTTPPPPMLTPSVVNATTGTTHSLIDNLVTPPAVPGTPSPLGDTGAPPVSMARPWSDAAYGAGSTLDDTERNLIAEGFDPEVVRRAKRRAMLGMGAVA